MPNIPHVPRIVVVLGLVLSIAGCHAGTSSSYVAVNTFSVWTIRFDEHGAGTVETDYVNPGSPHINKRVLGLDNVKSGSASRVFRNGKQCGVMDADFRQDDKILILRSGGAVEAFSRANDRTLSLGLQP